MLAVVIDGNQHGRSLGVVWVGTWGIGHRIGEEVLFSCGSFFSVRVFCAVSKKVELKPHLPPLVTRHTLAGVGQVGPFAHAMVAGTLMRRSGWLPFMQPL